MTDRRQRSAQNVLSRRAFLTAAATLPVLGACSSWRSEQNIDFESVEVQSGGRIGIAALDVASGLTLSHRGDERFAMCSTFKALLAGCVLRRVDQGHEDLARRVGYTADDLVVYSPLTTPGARRGGMSVAELCSAAVSHSDNSAANLLLATLGGPAGFTALLRETGDPVTRLDRLEPALNENRAGDPRDTTTPLAMLASAGRFLFSDLLSRSSQTLLREWMIATPTGLTRLRAGFPPGWLAGDKTGTSRNDQNNDLAFAIPPAGADEPTGAVLVVSFINAPDPFDAHTHELHARIAERALRALRAVRGSA